MVLNAETCVCAEWGSGCQEKKGRERERRRETRRDKDRNERFEPRNKNKQFLNPRQQWNSQLVSGLCFLQCRTLSGQPLSAPLTGFSQHPLLVQPASILNPINFIPLTLNYDCVRLAFQGGVGCTLAPRWGDGCWSQSLMWPPSAASLSSKTGAPNSYP